MMVPEKQRPLLLMDTMGTIFAYLLPGLGVEPGIGVLKKSEFVHFLRSQLTLL